jgi:hypothetical protein
LSFGLKPAFAAFQVNWEKKPFDYQQFWWASASDMGELVLDSCIGFNSDNIPYWNIDGINCGEISILESSTTWQEINTENWHLWVMGYIPADGATVWRRYKDGFGVYGETILDYTKTAEFLAGEDYIRIFKIGSFGATTTTSDIRLDTYFNFPTHIYAIVYTDEDLSYIQNASDFYMYLDTGLIAPLASTTPVNVQKSCEGYGTIGSIFCEMLVALFYPNENSLKQFSNLQSILENKAPFAYWFTIKNALNSFNASTTPVFQLSQQISQISIFGFFKTTLVWILWIVFAFWVIKRISRFEF